MILGGNKKAEIIFSCGRSTFLVHERWAGLKTQLTVYLTNLNLHLPASKKSLVQNENAASL